MSRKPQYHENNNRYRIISVANGLWQAQRRDGDSGGTREIDSWQPLCRPTSRAIAEGFMNDAAKPKGAAI